MAEQWWSKYKPTDYSFFDWRKEANRLYIEEGLNKDQIQEKIGYPVDKKGNPIKTTNKGSATKPNFDVRTGSRSSQASRRAAAATIQTVGEDVYNKGVVAPAGSKLEEHHKRVIGIYKPFFEGLNPKETKELAQWFVDEGVPLGNVKGNLEALTKQEHEAIHTWMKENKMQVSNKEFPSFKNMSLNERFPAVLTYLENIQPAADEQLSAIKQAASTNKLLFKNGGVYLDRAALTGLAAAGVAALGPLGTAASAAELQGRSKLAAETKNMMDELQVGIAGTSLAGDVASYFPPAAPIGEAVSTAADLANIGIDAYRKNPEAIKQFAQQQLQEKVIEPVTRPVKTVQRAIENPEEFARNELEYIGKSIKSGRLPYMG